MTIIIGGHGIGLQDGSLGLLNRNDATSKGTLGLGVETYLNVANGNLVLQERDAFLPSFGIDFSLVRTYNSRGAIQGSPDGWWWSTGVTLSRHVDTAAAGGNLSNYSVVYGDGSELHFDFDASRNLWTSTDGAGAYETLQQVNNGAVGFILTRADQTQYRFSSGFTLLSIVDTNGVTTSFSYQGNRLTAVQDDTGHQIVYEYTANKLSRVIDRHAGQADVTLVRYVYSQSLLTQVIDRFGHTTTYSYNNNGLLIKVALPFQQTVNGTLQTFDTREINFTYQQVNWNDHPHVGTAFDSGSQWIVTSITDPLGGVTTFDYAFQFSADALGAGDRDVHYKLVGGRKFQGGTTTVTDALGHKVSYTYDPDGYITRVVDQQGLATTYTYGGKTATDAQTAINQDNLLSVTDRNGAGATTSDSAYFRELRRDLGFVDAAGNGRLVAALSAAEITQILGLFTSRFTYDARGNMATSTDAAGNQQSWTHTDFNKVATATSAMGNALATSDDAVIQAKRVELGFAATVAGLSDANKAALRALYTTTYAYDARQNLTTRIDAGGDVTTFAYDANGNLTTRTVVYRDAAGVAVPAKNQVTTYAYDAFGNNTSIVDGEGATTVKTFDHFGNLLTVRDGRNNVTTHTYDADNRLLTSTDAEGHVTVNAYDAVGNRVSVSDAAGKTITQVFNRNNLLIATIDPSLSDPAATRTTNFTYDILGNRTSVRDAEGRTTLYQYDARRQLVLVTTPQVLNAGGTLTSYSTSYAYDGESRIVTLTDNNGAVTQSLYATNGLLKRVTDPVGNVTDYLYDANLQQVQITVGAQLAAALRRVLKFSYDEENQLVSQTDALGAVTKRAVDAPGNVVSVTDANNNTTQFEYDRNNRLVKETKPLLPGQTTAYTVLHEFDANGNEISTTDENGHKTTFAFDKDNQQVMISDANGIETVFTYDSRHNQTTIAIGVQAALGADGKPVISDASQGQVTTFVYDEFNQITSSTDGVGNALVGSDASVYQQLRTQLGFAALVVNLSAADRTALLNRFTERYAYDRVGNLVRSVDHLGRITALEYDALNRLQQRTEAQGLPLQRVTSLRYDGNGNVVRSVDALGRATVSTYDAANRLTQVTDPLGVSTGIEYDNVGNIVASTEALASATARRSEYIYDLNDRLVRERDPGAHEIAYEYDAVGNRLKVTDAKGGATQYVYDALNRNVRILDPLNFETRLEYDGVGNRIALIDARGGITRFEFDPGNRLVKTTDAEGRVTQLAYDALANVITQTTAFGTPLAEVTTFAYDAEGNLRSSTDAEGKTETRAYDDAYNYTRTTDRNGNITSYGFDALNRQLTVTDPLGGVVTTTYDLADNKLTETDALGRQRSFAYDADDRVIREIDAIGTVTEYAYDALDNQVSITRAAGTAQAATTSFVYDGDDRLIRQTDAVGAVTNYEYDANHNVTRIVDANNHATTYEYDANNQVTRIVDALGNATRFVYDGNGNRTQVIDARGNATTSYYNADNEVVLTIDAKGFASARGYDANGNVVSETLFMTPLALPVDPAVRPTPGASARDQTTTYEFDKLNRVTKRIDPLLGEQTVTYDAEDNRLTETDENGHTTTYEYDDNDRLTKTTDAKGGVTTSTYDAVGNRLTETDANGRTTAAAYDANNRIVSSTNALGDRTEFTYDAVGNRLTQKDPLGGIVTNQYDLVDRLTQSTDERGIRTTFEYDAVGNQTARTEAVGTADEAKTTSTYDEVNRLKTEADALGQVTSYGYDAVGNRTSVVEPNGQTTTTTFDALDQVETVTDAAGKSVSNAYDAAGNLVREVDANNRARVDYYDRNNRLVLTVDPAGFAESYTYDAAGNLASNTRHAVKVTLPVDPNVQPTVATDAADKKTSYTYDELDRIATITDGEGYVTTFTYDAVGNQTGQRQQVDKTDPSKDEVTRQYYDELDRLIATVSGEGHLSTVGYDKNGNVVERTDHDKKYTPPANGTPPTPDADDPGRKVVAEYDEKGRLTKETDPSGLVTTHEYDERDNETKVTEAPGTSKEHKKESKYDKSDRVVESTDALGIVTRYVYDSNGNLTQLIEAAGLPEQRTTSYVYNNLNQLTSQVDALGTINEYRYDAFGNLIGQTLAKGKAEERVESFSYDANNRLASQTNAEGEVTRFEYDGAGNQTATIVAEGLVGQERRLGFEYDRDHRLVAEIDGNGVRTEYRYDGMGNRTEVIQAVGIAGEERHSFYAYDKDGNLLSVTDAMGNVTRFEYDATGNQTRITDAKGSVTENTYDALGRLLTTLTGGVKTVNEYDVRNNIVKTTQSFADGSDARVTTYAYDVLDRQTLVTDGEGFSTRFTYDSFDNQIKLETGLYLLTATDAGYDAAKAARAKTVGLTFTYDALDRLLTTTTGENGVVAASYDAFGNRLTQTTRTAALGEVRTVTFKYDDAGRLIERTTPAGGLDTFKYDEAGNQIEQSTLQSGSGAGAVFLLTKFEYDGNGKVIAEIDALGTRTEHVLDAVGNEIETVFAAGATEERVLRSVFDLNNYLVAEIDGENHRTDYVVDKVGNRIKETDALGRVTHLYYDALGQHVGTLDPERYYTAFTRDAMGNITQSRIYLNRYAVPSDDLTPPVPAAADPARLVSTVFDRAGNPVAQTGADGGVQEFVYSSTRKLIRQTTLGNSVADDIARTSNSTPRVLSFEYDSADRMVTFTNVDGVVETYAYDSANNKTRETITNPNLLAGGRTDPVRTTSFEYDLDNRLTKQIFDPGAGGLQLTEQIGYDAFGNVVQRSDANNNVSTIAYDAVNRQTTVTDPLGGAIRYQYDRLGNQTAVIDPLGNRTDLKYDRNGLVIEELKPAVDVFTLAGGTQSSVRPKTTTQYDAAGNIVQIVDPAGNKTTRWYDGNDNLVAELSGDTLLRDFTALREYSWNATDDLVTATQYMTRLPTSAHNPLVRPAPPAGESRTVTNEYDAGGRLARIVYPSIEVTTVTGTDTAAPTSTKANVAVTEVNRFDRFGNLVESLDRNGNRTVSYYDLRGRVIAAVDAGGYLTESDYDSQDHVVQQRQYATALTGVSAGTKPAAPATPAAVVDRVYDVANRLVEETSAAVQLLAATERIVTTFTYDKVGNQTSRTLAAGTADAATEYSYYDANKRKVATVDAGRVLVQYGYDANNNNTLLKRFFDPVSAGVTLATASVATLLADVTADAANDQEKTSLYDALNRQTSQTDLMGPGAADDITVSTRFDSVGNVTSRTDPLGNVSRSAHDALGHIVQSITPDGSSTFFDYDTGGLRIRSWTGDLGSIQAVQATNVGASIGEDLRISYSLSTANNLRSYVVYDTAQHDLPGEYANQSAQQGAGTVSVGIALASFAAGTTLYFRVVSVDAAGSTAWTEERSVTVPARLTALSLSQLSSTSATVTVRFSGDVTTPQVLSGLSGGTLGTVSDFALQGDGSYLATVTTATDIQGFAYQLRWDFGGSTYTTSALSFEAPGAHTAVGQTVTIAVPPGANGSATAANGQFVVVNGVRIDTAFQSNGILQFNPGLTAAATDVPYQIYYGDLVSSTHTVAVSFEDHQSTFVLSDETTVIPLARTQVLRWQTDSRHTHIAATLSTTEAATIGAGGLHAAFKSASGTDVFSGGDITMTAAGGGVFNGTFNLAAGSYDILIYYFDSAGKQVIVEWRRITVPPAAALPADLSITDDLLPFDFAGLTATSGGVSDSTFPFNLSRTVAVGTPASVSGNSVIVAATERLGTISRGAGANGALTVDPGFYSGGLDPNSTGFTLPTTATLRPGPGTAKSDGLSAGTYFIETVYNAVGAKIATNEDTGQWRRFGVDGNGNAVETRVYGSKADETANLSPIVTFAAFDARNLEVATFGASVAVDTDGNGANDATQRAVTRSTFDFAGRLTSRTDPDPGAAARTFEYDATGNLTREVNALGQATTIFYDRRGREVRRTDARGNSTDKTWDIAGRMTSETDGGGVTLSYTHDAFDRVIRVTDELAHSAQFGYDQHDRLVSSTDGIGNITRYTYDKRDDRIWTQDANNHFFGTAYDSMRRVTHTYSFQGANPTSLADAIDAVGSTANPAHAALVDSATSYDIYGNKASETDAMGRSRYFAYGGFGRLVAQTDEGGRVATFAYDRFGRLIAQKNATSGQDIARSYDDAGRMTLVTDTATKVSSAYTYDAGGNRRHETVTALDFAEVSGTARNVTYTYNGAAELTNWTDSVTGKTLAYAYDAAGNLSSVIGSDSTSHTYSYDGGNRLLSIAQAGTAFTTYTYDVAGNRKTYNDGTTTYTYNYDAADRVIEATQASGAKSTWLYDAVGNIKTYQEFGTDGTTVVFTQSYTYSENNRTLSSTTKDDRPAEDDDDFNTSTTNTLDKSGRLTKEVLTDIKNENKTTEFQHTYTADGRETSVTVIGGTSETSGSSSSTYDANDRLIRLDLGQNDNQESAEYKRFIYNSDGQILRRFHDDGEEDTAQTTTTQYLYALGNPVGETGNDTDGNVVTVLDSGNYDLIAQQIGEKFPTSSVSDYEVKAGDTLRSIAQQIYGNPSLWFVIADANGLTGDERLTAGTVLKIPNTVELGRLTSDTHAVYSESEIVGSRLPNLKAPPPDDSAKCAAIGAIIGIILLAIVGVILSIVTVGIAAPAAAAAVGAAFGAAAGIIAGVLVGAAIGAAIAFGVSALSQLILVGAGLQKEFDWTQVLADTAVGFLSGGVAGLGQLLSAGVLVGRVAKIAVTVASVVLEAAGETLRQVIVNPDHRPDNPLSIVLAGVGGGFGAAATIASRAAKLQSAAKVAGAVERAGKLDKALTIGSKFRNTIRKLQDGTKIVKVVNKDGSVVFKQVTRLSAAAKGAPVVSKTIDFIGKGTGAAPVNTLAKIAADVDVVRNLTVAQRAQSVLVDAFGKTIGRGLFKVGNAVPSAASKLAGKVAPYAKAASEAVGKVTGKIGTAIAGAARTAATAIGGATGRVGTAIAGAARAVGSTLAGGARAAAKAVGTLGRNIGTGLAKLGGVLAKPFKAAAQGLVRTALGVNAAGQYRAARFLAIATLAPVAAVGKIGSLAVRGVGKVASVVASGAAAFGRAAGTAIGKFGGAVTTGFQKVAEVVGKVANGAAQKAASAVRAVDDALEVSRRLGNVGIFFGKIGRAGGRFVKDIVIDTLDPIALPATIIAAGAGAGRIIFRDEGDTDKRRALYFQSDVRRNREESERTGVAVVTLGASRPAYGSQGPANGIGKALFSVLSGELPYRPAYRVPTWENNAAATTTGVYSGFDVDRAINLRAINALNLIRLGRVAALDQATRDAYASSVIGRVSTHKDDVPIALLGSVAPNPSPIFGA